MNNEDYWKKRAEEREAEWTKKSKDTIEKELAKYYGQIRLKRSLPSITGGLFLVLLMILLFYTADMPKITILLIPKPVNF